MKAHQIMNYHARWQTWFRTVYDCDWAICFTTDNADWLESGVLCEGTLNARAIMEEVMK